MLLDYQLKRTNKGTIIELSGDITKPGYFEELIREINTKIESDEEIIVFDLNLVTFMSTKSIHGFVLCYCFFGYFGKTVRIANAFHAITALSSFAGLRKVGLKIFNSTEEALAG